MSKAALALFFVIAFSSCTPVAEQSGPTPSEAQEGIEVHGNPEFAIEVTVWGRVVERWELRPDRTLITWRQDINSGEHRNRRATILNETSYRQLLAATDELRSLRSLAYCDGAITDSSTTHYEWNSPSRRKELEIYDGCYSAERTPEIQKALNIRQTIFRVINEQLPTVPQS